MVAEPLPPNTIVLERLFQECVSCLDASERLTQRYEVRFNLIIDFINGQLTFGELAEKTRELDKAADLFRDDFRPSPDSIWEYCDQLVIRKARFLIEYGYEAHVEGAQKMCADHCFALMAANGGIAWLDGHYRNRLELRRLKMLIASALNKAGITKTVPVWNADTGKLLCRGKVVRKVRGGSVAKRIRAILDAFQADNWPDRVSAPPGFDPQTLREAIYTLNDGIIDSDEGFMRFKADGNGDGVICERG